MEGRVKRALRNLEDVMAHLLNALGNRPAVARLERERLQDEKVQGPLNEV